MATDYGITEWNTWGTTRWGVNSDGVLWIVPLEGETSGKMGDGQPYRSKQPDIKSIKTDGDISLPENAAGMFSGMPNLADMSGFTVSTAGVTNFSGMFAGCTQLVAPPDVSNWDLSSVTGGIGSMFYFCTSMVNPPAVSNWDVSKISGDNKEIFAGCSNMTSLDISGWDTTTLDISNLVDGCVNLKSLKTGVNFKNNNKNVMLPATMVEDNTTVRALRYAIVDGAHTYIVPKLTLDSNGIPDSTNSIYSIGEVVLPEPDYSAPDGWVCVGWNTAADKSGTTYPVGGTINILKDTTLYAVWSKNKFLDVDGVRTLWDAMKSQIASAYTLSVSHQTLIFTTPNGPKSRIYIFGDIMELVSWADGTDEQISNMILLADAGQIDLVKDAGWKVGDTRRVSLAAMEKTGTFDGVSWTVGESHAAQDVELVLMNVGGVKLADGNDCHFVVGMKDCLNESGYMNSSQFDTGSWDGCARRNWCNGAFRQALPEKLRGIFKQSNTITAKAYNGTELQTSVDYFFLPAERQIFGSGYGHAASNNTEAASTDLPQWTWYATTGNGIKQKSGSAIGWWERSPCSSYSNAFCFVNSSGNADWDNTANTYGIAPCGCI